MASLPPTLTLLEERLQRVYFLLHGDTVEDDSTASPSSRDTVAARLRRLEASMDALKTSSGTVQRLLDLRKDVP